MPNTLINYVEFKAFDLTKVKNFYTNAFGWEFIDYGPSYTAFKNSGIEGGFEWVDRSIVKTGVKANSPLVVLYHHDLEQIKKIIVDFGGKITVDIFSFPGGHRFHFEDPCENELAVWSDKSVK